MATKTKRRRVRRLLTEYRGYWLSAVRRRGAWAAQIIRKGSTIIEQTVTGPSRYAVLQKAARVVDAVRGD